MFISITQTNKDKLHCIDTDFSFKVSIEEESGIFGYTMIKKYIKDNNDPVNNILSLFMFRANYCKATIERAINSYNEALQQKYPELKFEELYYQKIMDKYIAIKNFQ